MSVRTPWSVWCVRRSCAPSLGQRGTQASERMGRALLKTRPARVFISNLTSRQPPGVEHVLCCGQFPQVYFILKQP